MKQIVGIAVALLIMIASGALALDAIAAGGQYDLTVVPLQEADQVLVGDGLFQFCDGSGACQGTELGGEKCIPVPIGSPTYCGVIGQSACSGDTRTTCTWDVCLWCSGSGGEGCGTQSSVTSCVNVGAGYLIICQGITTTIPCKSGDC
jgi:hypothetical protein